MACAFCRERFITQGERRRRSEDERPSLRALYRFRKSEDATRMTALRKLNQPPKYWDRLFAPSSCLAMITTVDAQGRVNAASYGTCTRVHHEPVYIAFTANV